MSNNFVPVPAPGENLEPPVPIDERPPSFVPQDTPEPAPAEPAPAEPAPQSAAVTPAESPPSSTAEAKAAAKARMLARKPKAVQQRAAYRQPHPTDPAEQQKAIAAKCQEMGIDMPLVRGTPEYATRAAARAAELNPPTMTQAEADARGITEPAALAKVGL